MSLEGCSYQVIPFLVLGSKLGYQIIVVCIIQIRYLHIFSYCSFSDIYYSMDVSCNCTWVGAWNRKSKGGPEVRFALFRGSCFVFYGER